MKFDEIKTLLQTKTVGIVGCGGLGSNCAAALVRLGIGKLIIADFDRVDHSNLNRQYYFIDQVGQFKVDALSHNLKRIDPQLTVLAHNVKLDSENIVDVFKNCDVIIEAFDLASMKQMMIETWAEAFPKIPLIVGNGMAGWGNSNQLKTEKLTENLYVCGDGLSEIDDEQPPLAPRVGIVAMMQANTALSILLNDPKNAQR